MTSYIVRIYRRGGLQEEIVGTVSTPGRDWRAPFHNFRELQAILLQEETDEAPDSPSKECPKDDK